MTDGDKTVTAVTADPAAIEAYHLIQRHAECADELFQSALAAIETRFAALSREYLQLLREHDTTCKGK